MHKKRLAAAVAALSVLAVAAPAQAGRENPRCELYEQQIAQAKEDIKAATPPARKAAKKLKGAKRALTNATGDAAIKKAKGKVRKAKKARNRTKAKLDEAKGDLASTQRRSEQDPRCRDDSGGGGPKGPKGPKGPR